MSNQQRNLRHAITALPTVLSCRLIQSSRCHRKACNVVEIDRQETAHKYGATKFRLRVRDRNGLSYFEVVSNNVVSTVCDITKLAGRKGK